MRINPFPSNVRVLFFYKGTSTGIMYPGSEANKLLKLTKTAHDRVYDNEFNEYDKNYYMNYLNNLEQRMVDLSGGGKLTKEIIRQIGSVDITLFAIYILHLLLLDGLTNDEMNGYHIITLVRKNTVDLSVAPTPVKKHISTVVNKPIEVDRTPKNFITEDINVLTKAELLLLGKKLGLQGLTKLSKNELIQRCNTRRTNKHFQEYTEEILCNAKDWKE